MWLAQLATWSASWIASRLIKLAEAVVLLMPFPVAPGVSVPTASRCLWRLKRPVAPQMIQLGPLHRLRYTFMGLLFS